MKKLMMVLALAAVAQFAYAQKSAEAVNKAIAAAQAACENPKKADKPATWLSLAKAYMESYTTVQLNGMLGMGRQEVQMVMAGKQPVSSSEEHVAGEVYTVDQYSTAKYYYNNGGQLVMIVPTVVYVEDALQKALAAYSAAAKVDPKGSKTKEISEGIKAIAGYYEAEARNAYAFGDSEKASYGFENIARTLATEPVAVVDSSALYNAASTAYFAKQYDRAIGLFKECEAINFLEDGEVPARMSECYRAKGDNATAKSILEEGFRKCPQNQGILIGLINIYNEEKDDPEKIIALLGQAKINEPTNASLYYVEGNILKEMGQYDRAAAAYDQCVVVNPECEMGCYYKGVMFLEQADKISEAAQQEVNDAKYMKLVEEFEAMIAKAAEPLEQAFAITKDDRVKSNVSQYLKNVYYRLRDKSDEYMAAYEKYNAIAKEYLGQ